MSAEEKAEKGATIPAGMINLGIIFYLFQINLFYIFLGNTCYMNATLECFRHMKELRESLVKVPINRGSVPHMMSSVLRETLNALDR